MEGPEIIFIRTLIILPEKRVDWRRKGRECRIVGEEKSEKVVKNIEKIH